jgi:hypothetical protein
MAYEIGSFASDLVPSVSIDTVSAALFIKTTAIHGVQNILHASNVCFFRPSRDFCTCRLSLYMSSVL